MSVEITLFEAPVLSFESYDDGIIQPDDFTYYSQVDYADLDKYRDEIIALLKAYDDFTWPDDRDEFAKMEADYNDVKALLVALDYSLNEFSRYESLLPEDDFDEWAIERFYECYEVPNHLARYLDDEKIVRDMHHDYGMACGIGHPFENKEDFYIV
jgi:hypothetical protein